MGTRQEVIAHVKLEQFSSSDVASLCQEEGISPAEAGDFVALSVARGCLAGDLSWRLGDVAMNRLFEWAYCDNGPGLSDFAWLVYSAFVVGEERHVGQPADSGAEYFSLPLLELACRKLH